MFAKTTVVDRLLGLAQEHNNHIETRKHRQQPTDMYSSRSQKGTATTAGSSRLAAEVTSYE